MADEPASDEDEFQYDMVDELLGAINELPEADHGRVLKSFLLGCIDTMREHALFQLDLLEKLASIAHDNVQDVRLHSLEARLEELEAGKPVTFGQVLGELFFVIAVEAVMLVGLTTGAAPVAGVMASVITGIKTGPRALKAMRRRALTAKSQAAVDRARSLLAKEEQRLLVRLHARMPRKFSDRVHPTDRRELRATHQEIIGIREKIAQHDRTKEQVILNVVDGRLGPEDLTQVAPGLIHADFSRGIRTFLEGFSDHKLDAGKETFRAVTKLASFKYPHAFAEVAPPGIEERLASFTTTDAILEMTAQCESLKLDVILHYAMERAILANVPDDEVLEAFETVLVLEEVENNLLDTESVTEDMLHNLKAFAMPMELAIWLLYLKTNKTLERDEAGEPRTITGAVASDRFIGNDFVEEIKASGQDQSGMTSSADPPRSSVTSYVGQRYSGLSRLDEHQAYYLFHKFAGPLFHQFADRVPISKDKALSDFIHRDVAAKVFDAVLEMQKVFFLTGENQERTDLVKEMGVVVIEFFNFLQTSVAGRPTLGFSDAIPEGTTISDLFAAIDGPPSAGPPSATAPMILESWQGAQDAARLADWEERIMESLLMLEVDYDAAVQRYDAAVKNAGKYREDFTTEEYEDLFLSTPKEHLSAVQRKIQALTYHVRTDPKHRSTATVEERIDVLEVKLSRCPIPSEFGSTRLPD